MAEKIVKRSKYGRKVTAKTGVPYSKWNYQIFGLGLLIILVGYWALAQGPVNGFLTLTLAPILLIIGYCVLIPLAIISTGKFKLKHKE